MRERGSIAAHASMALDVAELEVGGHCRQRVAFPRPVVKPVPKRTALNDAPKSTAFQAVLTDKMRAQDCKPRDTSALQNVTWTFKSAPSGRPDEPPPRLRRKARTTSDFATLNDTRDTR
jgi:hypothetical protein